VASLNVAVVKALIDPIFLYIAIITLVCMDLLLVIAGIAVLVMFPSLRVILFSKRFVWEVASDGIMEAKPAKTIGGAYITSTGTYFFEKRDVLSVHGKKCVIAHASTDSKVIRPEIQPVLSIMKKLKIDTREKLEAILGSPLVSQADYQKLLSANRQGENNG
jgi:hypothetical protein